MHYYRPLNRAAMTPVQPYRSFSIKVTGSKEKTMHGILRHYLASNGCKFRGENEFVTLHSAADIKSMCDKYLSGLIVNFANTTFEIKEA